MVLLDVELVEMVNMLEWFKVWKIYCGKVDFDKIYCEMLLNEYVDVMDFFFFVLVI